MTNVGCIFREDSERDAYSRLCKNAKTHFMVREFIFFHMPAFYLYRHNTITNTITGVCLTPCEQYLQYLIVSFQK